MKDPMSLGFIGGGRVTRIILGGFRKKGKEFAEIVVSDLSEEALARLRALYPNARTILGDNKGPAVCDLVFLALHPPACGAVLDEIKGVLRPDAILISLAPKLTISRITERLGGFSRVGRMIPNAPSIVGAGYNPITYPPGLDNHEWAAIGGALGALGECPEVPEKDLEAYAVLAAMGPTYFWFQWEELEGLGTGFGLSSENARKALAAMAGGAAKAYFESGLSAAEVMDLVPVKPLKDDEEDIRSKYRLRLNPLFEKIRP
jgi:pyrroline-5-carboxylate reductase